MKKLLLIMLVAAAVMANCTKEESTKEELVKNVEMPPISDQFSSGASVMIKGCGFTKTDAIYFRAMTKSGDIDALITEVTASQITFIVPSGLTSGENGIFLKRSGAEQLLGKLAISDIPDAKLYGFGWEEGDRYSICEIDRLNGNLTEIKILDDGEDISNAVCIGQILYGIYWPKSGESCQIVSFDLSMKSFKKIAVVNDIECLGVIQGRLHVLTSHESILTLSKVDTQSGTLSPVADFGRVSKAAAWEGTSETPFTYDAANNKILVIGWWYEESQRDEWAQPIVLDVAQRTQTLLSRFTKPNQNWENIFTKAEQICVTISRILNHDTEQENIEYDIYTLNSRYELNEKTAKTSDYCFSWQYDAKSDIMYGGYEVPDPNSSDPKGYVSGVSSFDFKTLTFKRIKHDVNIYEVVLVR